MDPNGEWAAAIGQAFVAFGAIEHITVVCLQQIPRDRIQRSTKTLRLGQRIELIVEILEGHDGNVYRELATKLKRAQSLAETRNLIAHNPLVFDFYERQDGTLFHRQVMSAIHKDKDIALPELQQFASDSEQLVAELYQLSTEVFKALRSSASA